MDSIDTIKLVRIAILKLNKCKSKGKLNIEFRRQLNPRHYFLHIRFYSSPMDNLILLGDPIDKHSQWSV